MANTHEVLEGVKAYTLELLGTTYRDAAEASASRSESGAARSESAAARSESARDAAESTVANALNNAADSVRGEVKADADRADQAAATASTSESNAKSSETSAGDYAAVATTAAAEAVDAMERATDLAGGDFATHEYVDNAVAGALRVDTTAGTRVFAGGQMIYGDTGLRKVEDLASGISFNTASHTMTIRRVGDEVILEGFGVRTVSDTWITGTIPLGFQPRQGEYRGSRGLARVGSTLMPMGNSSTLLRLSIIGTLIEVGATVDFSARWSTADAWPASLPGTPA